VQMERARRRRRRRRRRNASASVCGSDVSMWKDRDDKVESDFGGTSDDNADHLDGILGLCAARVTPT
jgi:hypothetical protein